MAQTFQYRIISSDDAEGGGFLRGKSREDVEGYLNELGRDGWEIIDIDFRISMDGGTRSETSFFGLAKRSMG